MKPEQTGALPIALRTLKTRSEFLRLRGGARHASAAFVMEARPRSADDGDTEAPGASRPEPRFGFTVTKKLGNAVRRNRIRRRLKAAVAGRIADADSACDYVIVARDRAHDVPFADLVQDIRTALRRIARQLAGAPGRSGRGKS
ncbi:MAG: ribonuclease P protein component [Hyphomicrobiaceae bacterium]|nr:ribonuclease P protein component [Hyphomicrobiaceae bacterium]